MGWSEEVSVKMCLKDEAEPDSTETPNQVDRAASQGPGGEKKFNMFDKYKEVQRNSGKMVQEKVIENLGGCFKEYEFSTKYDGNPSEGFQGRDSTDES